MRRVYPDANVLIYLVEDPSTKAAIVRALLQPADGDNPVLVFSELTRLECRVLPLRSGNVAVAAVYDTLFSDARHHFTPMDRACFETATALRAAHGLKTPDALHLAAALQAGCDEFWTNDQRLAQAAQGRMSIVNLLSPNAA